MSILQFRFKGYRFRPTLLGALITICCIPLFIKLGLWQYHKAQQKMALRAVYQQYEQTPPARLPPYIAQPEQWRYRPVKIAGEYLPHYQILLDNQLEQEQVGYQVITPLRIEHSQHVVLINRGWIAGGESHSEVPQVATPSGRQELTGKVWLPSQKFYSLEAQPPVADQSTGWNKVWQNMDMQRYQASVPFDILPVAVRLDAHSSGGGFVRNWVMPDDRVATNIGYAYQWFGFAVAALLIFIAASFKKTQR